MTATLLIARHGQADYEHPGVVSDEGGWLTSMGRRQVTDLANSLTGRKIVAVYSSRLERAIAVDGLHEFRAGDLAGRPEDDPELAAQLVAWLAGSPDAPIPGGAETGTGVLRRYRDALHSIAADHRDETVLVVSHGGVMIYCLPRLGDTQRHDLDTSGYLLNCALVEVAAGENGFEIGTWPEMADWPTPDPPAPG